MEHRRLRFALFGNIYQARKSASIQKVLSCIANHDAELYVDMEYYYFLKDNQRLSVNATKVFNGDDFDADFVISMGGDGTFLKAASRVGHKDIPILGVNMGRLGFLADISPDDIEHCINALAQDDFAIESRALIQVEADGNLLGDFSYALNDVAILKRDTASMISIRANINGQYLNTYQADGLVVSTPTGSTAYSLSNGGPIIVPGTKVFSMTAVAPHSLNVRPIVIPDSAVVELDVESRSHNFLVAIDGRSEKCKEGTKITLRRAPYDVKVVKRSDHRYFNTLREKMMWGADSR
ncbi:MAG: NAD kinase [Prevotella sp.]|jgi:NAD+ kinase|nr:NAD kinase [Prevotella sp.]